MSLWKKIFRRSAKELSEAERLKIANLVDGALATTHPDLAHKCDVCSTLIFSGGYCLTTREVIRSQQYWEKAWDKYSASVKLYGVSKPPVDKFLDKVKNLADSQTPWIVCDNCISLFSVDKDNAKSDAFKWWSSGKRFVPAGNGPAPISDIVLPTERCEWARTLYDLIRRSGS